jgi:hypothetical protein
MVIKAIWLFLSNLICIDSLALREDSRKIGLGLITAGLLGFVMQSDKVTSYESALLFFVGMIVWMLALLQPSENNTED